MRILGVDPGTRVAGYGLVDVVGPQIRGVAAGAWQLDGKLTLAARLAALAVQFRRVADAYEPTHLCVELAFVAENVRSALFLGHARGVILSEAYQRGMVIHEISATAAKKAIVNYGRADKAMVAAALSRLLHVSFENLPHDASDALGIAYAQALQELEKKRFHEGVGRLLGASGQGGTSSADLFSKMQASERRKKKVSRQGFEVLLKK